MQLEWPVIGNTATQINLFRMFSLYNEVWNNFPGVFNPTM